MYVCICNAVTDCQIRKAYCDGACSMRRRNRNPHRAITSSIVAGGKSGGGVESSWDLADRISKTESYETGRGGKPGRGVDSAIELFQARVDAGDQYIAGSDIKNFFTKIPRLKVLAFLKEDGLDEDFIGLVADALSVELENADRM